MPDPYDTSWLQEGVLVLEPRSTFDRAIVGVVQRFNEVFLVYSRERVVQALVHVDGMAEEEAIDWYNEQIVGGWHGSKTPAFLLDAPFPKPHAPPLNQQGRGCGEEGTSVDECEREEDVHERDEEDSA